MIGAGEILELERVEIKADLDEATAEALRFADVLTSLVAAEPQSPRIAQLAAAYQEKRVLIRRLRRLLKVEVSG